MYSLQKNERKKERKKERKVERKNVWVYREQKKGWMDGWMES